MYQPSQADIIILVTSRPSEDLLAVYDAHQGPGGNYLWRVMGHDGLQAGETPLVTQFEKGFESVEKQEYAPQGSQVEASEPRTADVAHRSNLILCDSRRPRFSPHGEKRGRPEKEILATGQHPTSSKSNIIAPEAYCKKSTVMFRDQVRCGQSAKRQFVSSAISSKRLYLASRSDWRMDPFLNWSACHPTQDRLPMYLRFLRYGHSV